MFYFFSSVFFWSKAEVLLSTVSEAAVKQQRQPLMMPHVQDAESVKQHVGRGHNSKQRVRLLHNSTQSCRGPETAVSLQLSSFGENPERLA